MRKMRVSESTAVIETEPAVVEEDSKENELLKEPVGCDEITVTEEAPGIAKARKTLDQLGYVLETDLGKDFQKLQPSGLYFRTVMFFLYEYSRTAAVYWKSKNAVKMSR